MIDFDKWHEIFDSIRRHKLRTFLTAFSVWWGIFMLVILLGSSKGLQNSTKENFEADAINSLWIWSEQTSEPYKGLPAGRWIRFDNEDYEDVADMGEVNYASARFWMSGEFFISYEDKSLAFEVQCVR
ncbi:MAG: ABC transporter permease, partial [Bacteroidota bacterium]